MGFYLVYVQPYHGFTFSLTSELSQNLSLDDISTAREQHDPAPVVFLESSDLYPRIRKVTLPLFAREQHAADRRYLAALVSRDQFQRLQVAAVFRRRTGANSSEATLKSSASESSSANGCSSKLSPRANRLQLRDHLAIRTAVSRTHAHVGAVRQTRSSQIVGAATGLGNTCTART